MSNGQAAAAARERTKHRSDAPYLQAVNDFEAAVHHFQKERFDKAKEIFEKLAQGPVTEVAARARVHLQLCEQKLRTETAPTPKTAEDCYNLGLFELNAGRAEAALEHLAKADKLNPRQEYVLYALAAAHARLGNIDAALTQLSQAIELRPQNRHHARRDEDFQPLANEPRFKKLTG